MWAGLENEKNVFPKWVVDLVLGQSPRPEEIPKRNFSVVPAEGSSLQPLRDSSLTASCIVKLRKVCPRVPYDAGVDCRDGGSECDSVTVAGE